MVDDEGGDRRWLVLRAGVAALCSLVAAGVAVRLQLPLLDVALYAVLTPIVALTLLIALPRAGSAVRVRARGPATPSVVPEPYDAPAEAVKPIASGPETMLIGARERVVAAGAAGSGLEELLALSTALHDAALGLARTTLAGGGDVPQELRDEIALQDRAEQLAPAEAEPRTPVV